MIEIVVRGTPAPQGSKRHVGNGRMVEMSKAVGPWREAVRAETQRAMEYLRQEKGAFTGPVKVRVWFWLKRPAGHYRTGKNAHLLREAAPVVPAGTPDIDKLCRAVLDGLTMGGAWKDDGQVAELQARKLYVLPGMAPGCRIEISEVAG